MMLAWANVSKGGENWVGLGNLLKVQSTRLAVGFNVGNEKKKNQGWS